MDFVAAVAVNRLLLRNGPTGEAGTSKGSRSASSWATKRGCLRPARKYPLQSAVALYLLSIVRASALHIEGRLEAAPLGPI